MDKITDKTSVDNAIKCAKTGDWVQIRRVVLEPGERAPNLPDDTRSLPLVMWAKGFLENDASLGDEVTITTFAGRKIQGTLVDVNPRYEHGFGEVVPELQGIGLELRRMLCLTTKR